MWPISQPFEAESPLSPSECSAILAASKEDIQWMGPWPLDQPFMGEVSANSIYLSCGKKPYALQPVLSATLTQFGSGTSIKGFFTVRRGIFLSGQIPILLFLGSGIYVKRYDLAFFVLLFFAILILLEQSRVQKDKKLLVQDLTQRLKLTVNLQA